MAQKKEIVYIVGHRNPDTDSICSAIAYADIKNRTELDRQFLPMRAGQINEETEFVLKHFHIPMPGYLPDAGTQVSEIEIHKVPGTPRDLSVKKAWKVMTEEGIVTLPITSGKNKLEGLITVTDIAKSYMEISDSHILADAHTRYDAIADTLDGEILVGDGKKYFTEGRVVIGAFHPDMMEQYIQKNDLVIVGNRAEDQLCCLDLKASCMVVGLGAKVSSSILKLAEEDGCTIISSPHDTYTITRLINQAVPVEYLMRHREKLICFHTTDKVDEIEQVMKNSRHRDYPVLDTRERYIGTISRRNLIGLTGKNLILVDHNETTQAVLNVEEANVLEIIDHHRLGSLQTMGPILFRCEPIGCTATIMYKIYHEKHLEIPAKIAGLLMSAIISDTLLFRSPTCTPMDKNAAEDLAEIAGVKDINAYAASMFRAGSNLEDKTPEEIFFQDYKKFNIEDTNFGVGQISSMSAEELEFIKSRLLPQMKEECGKHDIEMVFFMLTNIIDESTELLYFGTSEKNDAGRLVKTAFPESEPDGTSAVLQGVISRKKQLIPAFMRALQERE
ncbi:MAG: putative manganese-dependent inorganic diphosphatase [Bilifractor sp.]|jgi:manganese-dependent inorganic pyrophosphatase|nr:putative manganese-dependent inorganic diphosphatase [Lachnospiraceae bacterium]